MSVPARLLFLILTLVLIPACTSGYSLVSPGQQRVGNASLFTPASWNRLPAKYLPTQADAVWTQNGTNLDSVIFFTDIGDRKTLFPAASPHRPYPAYDHSMTPQDIMELTESSFRIRLGEGNARVGVSNLVILPLGRFRFSMDHTAANGFRLKGMVFGGTHRDRLWLVVYQAAEQYYFENSRTAVERIFSSYRIVE